MQKLEKYEEENYVSESGKRISKSKALEAGVSEVCSRKSAEAHVTHLE